MPNTSDTKITPPAPLEGEPIAEVETDAELRKRRMERDAMREAQKAEEELKRDKGQVRPTWT